MMSEGTKGFETEGYWKREAQSLGSSKSECAHGVV